MKTSCVSPVWRCTGLWCLSSVRQPLSPSGVPSTQPRSLPGPEVSSHCTKIFECRAVLLSVKVSLHLVRRTRNPPWVQWFLCSTVTGSRVVLFALIKSCKNRMLLFLPECLWNVQCWLMETSWLTELSGSLLTPSLCLLTWAHVCSCPGDPVLVWRAVDSGGDRWFLLLYPGVGRLFRPGSREGDWASKPFSHKGRAYKFCRSKAL